MASIEEKRRQRAQLMTTLYERTDGRPVIHSLSLEQLSDALGWTDELTREVLQYLCAEGLAEWITFGQLGITHPGVLEVEEALSEPTRPTQHFAPVTNVTIHGNVSNSPIQAGSPGGSQEVTITGSQAVVDSMKAIKELLTAIKGGLESHDVAEADRARIQANTLTVEAQLLDPEPDPGIVRKALGSIRAVVENLVASGIWHGAPPVWDAVQHLL